MPGFHKSGHIYATNLPTLLFRYFFINQSDCSELCISFDPYSFFEINNFLIYLCSQIYRIAGKFGEFGESSAIRQTKTNQISSYH